MERVLILVALAAAPITSPVFPSSLRIQPSDTGASATPSTPIPAAAPARKAADKYQRVEIRTADEQNLVGSFFAPTSRSGQPSPGCLLVHDTGAERGQMEDLADRLQKLGFAVLALDLRGHGESKAAGANWADLDADAQAALWTLAARDVEAGAKWLVRQEHVHSTNLSLVGFGAGCALAVRQATRDENVRCIALLAPRSKEFGFDVEADLKDLGGLPTLVLAPREAAETVRMVEAANQVSHPYITLVATTNSPSVLEDKKTFPKVASWIKEGVTPKKGR